MIGRKRLIQAALSMLLLTGLLQPADTASIVIVKKKDILPFQDAISGFSQVLEDNLNRYKLQYLDQPDNRFLERLKPLKPDIIFVLGTSVTQLVSSQVSDIPIIFSMVVAPANNGIDGINLTGVSLDIPVSIQFMTLKQVLPSVKTVGVLYNPGENKENIQKSIRQANALGLTLKPFAVNDARGIPNLEQLDIDALWFIADTTVCQPPIIKRLLLMGLKNHIPVMGLSSIHVRAGALLALTCDYKDIGRQAGEAAINLIKGKKASDMGIMNPRKVNLVLNLAVAKRLGLKIPKKIIKKAVRVYGQ